ncbi:CBM35 domain-containing protein [Sphaerisporangium flaviroseum]|uniref:CBM35 domain-containing protein n=1 Tax=Sphaerisporangium flaviroseum TaxID=509199 RepID=UPI0031F0B981
MRRPVLTALCAVALLATAAPAPATAAPAPATAAPAPATAAPAPAMAGQRAAATWQQRWSPSASQDGLDAFETLEDDRADSHPAGQPHIFTEGNNFRFTMHMVDRDTSTDRQRQEVTGMRTPAGGPYLVMKYGETWRFTYSMYIPGSLKATTTFTHIMQLKQPGTGTLPMMTMSLRRHGSTPMIDLNAVTSDRLVGQTPLTPLQNKWIDVEVEVKIGDSDGSLRFVVRDAGTTVVDSTATGVDTWLADRVRPKWGIYRSLGDSSGSLQDCYLLITNMRAYQLVSSGSARYEAEDATISGGVVESNHAGFTGTGFVNFDNAVGGYAQFSVNAAQAGNATLTLRYANGTSANRPMDITVNGALVADEKAFAGTGAWTTWQTTTVTVPLKAGANTIRTTGSTANGGPNLDNITIG